MRAGDWGQHLVLACGCSGHAFKFGPALGRLVADVIGTGADARICCAATGRASRQPAPLGHGPDYAISGVIPAFLPISHAASSELTGLPDGVGCRR